MGDRRDSNAVLGLVAVQLLQVAADLDIKLQPRSWAGCRHKQAAAYQTARSSVPGCAAQRCAQPGTHNAVAQQQPRLKSLVRRSAQHLLCYGVAYLWPLYRPRAPGRHAAHDGVPVSTSLLQCSTMSDRHAAQPEDWTSCHSRIAGPDCQSAEVPL